MRFCTRIFIAVLWSSLAVAAVNSNLFSALHWRLIGPFRGGRAVAVSGVRGGGTTFFFGGVNGGVWKSDNAGVTWSPIFDGQPTGAIGALEVAPSDPNVIYAGTGESDIRSDLASGDGVYKSEDGGKTWRNIGLKDTRQISRIVIDPHDPKLVFIAALGHAYGPNEERGVFRSRDGGQTWQKVLYKDANTGAAEIAIAADSPNILFAAMWNAHRPPWSTYAPISGPGNGLFRSKDGGDSWQPVAGNGFPEGALGRIGVAVANGTSGKRVYSVIESAEPDKAGLYRSDDGGDSWNRVNGDPRLTSRGWYFNCITADPTDPDVIYVPNVAFYKVSDGGKTITILRGAPGGDDYHQVWIDPANSSHMALASDQGTSVSLDAGRTWSSWYNQPTAQFYHVVTDNAFPYSVYGSQQDSGTAATVSRTDHGEIDLRDWFTVGGSESGYIAPDPRDPNIFYVSGVYGSLERIDRRTLQSQNIAPWPDPGVFGKPVDQRKYRDPWTPVLLFSPAKTNALYLGTQYVMRTLDGGLHWQTISPDLTGAEKNLKAQKGAEVTIEDAAQRGYGVVYTVAPSPLAASQIWAGSDTGLIHLTRTAGKTWNDVTPPGVSRWSKIAMVEASHFSPGIAFAAIDRHRLDDQKPYLFRTRDFGKTWQAIVNGIPENAFVNAIREDPKKKGLLFAGTELGVYVSFNEGDNWTSLQENLPVTSIRDLAIHGNDLVVATHGRSFWAMDDISPLRQAAEIGDTQGAFLFKPAAAIRTHPERFAGTPVPPDEPQAQNPPSGAYIDYYLPHDAAGEVVLTIQDRLGKVVRRFSSRAHSPKTPENLPIAARWLPAPQMLSEDAGMHRFVWDLHSGTSDTASELDPDEPSLAGPLVLPGQYRVLLKCEGRELTQPLAVVLDPRVKATPAELASEYDWAHRAFTGLASARKTVQLLQGLSAQLKDRADKLTAEPLRNHIAELQTRIGHILAGESPLQPGLRSAARNLSAAMNAIDSADRTPPSQAIAFYQESAALARKRTAEWNALKRQSLEQLNRELGQSQLPPLNLSEIERGAAEERSQ